MLPENPERVSRDEIRRMREQVQAAVACRISGVDTPPIEDLVVPEFVKAIITELVEQFHAEHPGGLPAPPSGHETVSSYQRRAAALFDAQVADQFTLEPL